MVRISFRDFGGKKRKILPTKKTWGLEKGTPNESPEGSAHSESPNSAPAGRTRHPRETSKSDGQEQENNG